MRFHFGECDLDTGTRQLIRAGQTIHLSPKAFQLLQVLLEQRPRALSKAEIHERLWPGTYVLEANLPNLVAEVRTAIGDDARKPAFVRTVHGFGYAFCGLASELGSARPPMTDSPFVYRLVSEGNLIALVEGDHLLGRHPNSVVPVDSHTVSRRHALLRVLRGQAVLEDLGSKNGTFVGGQRLTAPARLADGDEFRLGSVSLTFRVFPAEGFTETEG